MIYRVFFFFNGNTLFLLMSKVMPVCKWAEYLWKGSQELVAVAPLWGST